LLVYADSLWNRELFLRACGRMTDHVACYVCAWWQGTDAKDRLLKDAKTPFLHTFILNTFVL